jgi:D-alanyl-D-alanine carboxypeptidase
MTRRPRVRPARPLRGSEFLLAVVAALLVGACSSAVADPASSPAASTSRAGMHAGVIAHFPAAAPPEPGRPVTRAAIALTADALRPVEPPAAAGRRPAGELPSATVAQPAGEPPSAVVAQPAVVAPSPTPAAPESPVPPAEASPVASGVVPASASPAVAASPPGSAGPGDPGSPAPSADPLASPTPAPTFDPATAAVLQQAVDAARARAPLPGISVAIRLADGRSWTGVSGDRVVTPATPVDAETVFSVASITKTFITAAVMQLVAEGRLSLDDHLAKWLPRVPGGRGVTIRDMLGHTSGIYDYFTSPRYNARVFADPKHRWTFDEIMGFVGRPYCAPGTCFHYSNTNFVLLGRIVELVTGEPIANVLRTRFFDPLGMADTVFQPDMRTPRDAAHGYIWGGGSAWYDQTGKSHVIPTMSTATIASTAGAIASSASDLARWVEALYGGDVVRPDLLAAMTEFRPHDYYGLGTRTRIYSGRRAVGHTGSLRGFDDAMWYFPREGATIVVLTNRNLYGIDKVVKSIARTLFTQIGAAPPEYDPKLNTHG